MNSIRLKYKQDTGKTPQITELSVVRSKGKWIIDMDNHTQQEILEVFGRLGSISIPDEEYIEWLEFQL